MITMGDIAKKAGVSRATVSYVLNQRHQDRLNLETQERVLKAAEELGYRPNLAARGLKNRKTMLVGTLVQNHPGNQMTHPLTWAFILGINDGLAFSGYTTVLVRLTDMVEDGGLEAPVFKGHLLDGLIVVNKIPAELEKSVELLVPQCVWLDSNVWSERCCIRRDEFYAGQLAMKKVAEMGFRKVFCCRASGYNAPDTTGTHYSLPERLSGIHFQGKESGVEVQEFTLPGGAWSFWAEEDWATIHRWLDEVTPHYAIIVENIYAAELLLQICAMRGKRPGRDFGFACCDDHIGYVVPQLARVSFERYEMGQVAAAMMLDLLENMGEGCKSRLIRGEWLPGETLQPAPSS